MRDKHQIIEEPCEVKISRTVLKTSGTGDSLAEFNTIAIVGETGAKLDLFAPELKSQEKQIRRLQRRMERSRRANNQENYHSDFVNSKGRKKKGAVKKGDKKWNDSKGYRTARSAKANLERKLAAHRKSLHGRLAHEILKLGDTIKLEKLSYKAFGEAVWKVCSQARAGRIRISFKTLGPKCWRYCSRVFHPNN